MRKIETKRDREKKAKKNQTIVGIVLIFLMFMSVLGYGFVGRTNENSNDDNEEEFYNGYEFVNVNGLWRVNFGNSYLFFIYSPNQISRETMDVQNWEYYNGKDVYLYSDNVEAESEIYYNLGRVSNILTACYYEEDCTDISLKKTCDNDFIILKESEEVKIRKENKCVFIEGPSYQLTALADEFLFNVFEII